MANPLEGKTITDVKIAEDQQAIMFITPDGPVIARADGDCCSYSWVEHIEMPALGLPAKVTSVEDLDMPREPEDDDGEFIQFYGCKITTDKGEIVIDYRNSSNGYYGGDLVWPDDDYFYGGVFGQNVSDEKWVNVCRI